MDKTSYDKRTRIYKHADHLAWGIEIYPRMAHFERIGSLIRIRLGRHTISHRTGRK